MSTLMGTMTPVLLNVQHQLRRNDSIAAASWLNVVSHLDPKYGGLSAAVPALSSAVADTGRFGITLAGFCHNGEHFAPPVAAGVSIHHAPATRLGWLRDSAGRRAFRELVARSQGVHIHGLWEQSTAVAASLARTNKKPYVISAHGMLESWAVGNKKVKKAIYAALFERRNLEGAACLHALTQAEVADYRRFGLSNPVAVIPNGVHIPSQSSGHAFLQKFPELRGKRLVLFLGRIHFKKGLDLLSQAWAGISAKWPDAHLVLAGPDSENTQSRVEAMLQGSGIWQRATFTGMLNGEMKWSALRAAECFVLPSYSEGLSVSVLEAMGMGLPVIVTEQCNLPEVASHGCGWTIQPRADDLALALDAMLRAPLSELTALGSNGRDLVARRYSWQSIGEQMAAVYRWTAGGPPPTQVEIHQRVKA